MTDKLLTAEQLAECLRVKPRTVQKWQRDGHIPATRLTSKVIRYDFDAVVTALSTRQQAMEVNDAAK